MIKNSYEHNCPTTELLSAFCDCGAAESDLEMTAIARHVDACDACRRTVEAYRQLDRLVAAVCQPPAGLEKRILAAVKTSEQTQVDRPWRLRVFRLAQAAAVVAVLALAAAAVMRYAHSDRDDVTLAQHDQEPAVQIATVETETKTSPDAGAVVLEEAPERLRATGSVRSNDVQTVGIDRNGARAAAPVAQYYLPTTVRHVWTTSDLQQSRRLLDTLAKDGNGVITWTDADGSLSGKIQLEDGKLQALSTACTAAACSWCLRPCRSPGQALRSSSPAKRSPTTWSWCGLVNNVSALSLRQAAEL
ncbi:MAG TPA: hypothetical protein PKY10_03870 [Lentisphaeria bacterium]|nr:hypothetical protein [Lentisphaeria bacterium]